jgi:signal transduction histidine kinase
MLFTRYNTRMVRARWWGVAVVLVLALAALNVRWVDRLREADVAQMRLVAAQRAEGFVQEVDRELGRAYDLFNTEPSTLRGEDWSDFLFEYDAWMAKASQPALLRSWYVVYNDGNARVEGDGLVLRRFDAHARRFREERWPAELARVRDAVERENAQRLRHALPEEQPHIGPEVDTPAALLIPLFSSAVAVQTGHGPAYGYVIVLVDTEFLRTQFFPALARKYFGDARGLEYDVTISRAADPTALLYRSTEASPGAPDFETRLFHLGFTHLGEPFIPTLRGAKPAGAAPEGLWLLRGTHRDGSIAAHVGAQRRRDVLLSVAVMGLLVASLALVFTSARRARRLAMQQTAFVAGVSHELRTPLAVIRSAAENLADGLVVEPERVRRYGQLVVQEGRRLSHLVEQAIDLAALEAGARPDADEIYDIKTLIDEIAAQAHVNEVMSRVVAPLPQLKGDPRATRQVIANLVENARKHAPGSPVVIGVEAIDWRGRAAVRIEVVDRGDGIALADLPHVFEPFYRGERARREQVPGSGLGLSIVKRLVEKQRGTIAVRSTPGKGCTFVVCLPGA